MSDVPETDGLSAPFWKAAAEGQLVLPRCGSCERFVWYPRALCPHCGASALGWVPSEGRGTVYAVSVHHKPSRPELAELVPYAVVLVDLDEGVRLMARAVDMAPHEVEVGRRVRWRPAPDGDRAFVFGPA